MPSFASIVFHVLHMLIAANQLQLSRAIDIDARTRSQWQEISTSICPSFNYTSCAGADRSTWTKAARTEVHEQHFVGLGAWSTFKLVTHDQVGKRKARGGDSWFVLLRERRRRLKVPTRVYDDGDGTYTVAAFLLQPGNYSLAAWLWYRCVAYALRPRLFRMHSDTFHTVMPTSFTACPCTSTAPAMHSDTSNTVMLTSFAACPCAATATAMGTRSRPSPTASRGCTLMRWC